jgi:hypothetical protein
VDDEGAGAYSAYACDAGTCSTKGENSGKEWYDNTKSQTNEILCIVRMNATRPFLLIWRLITLRYLDDYWGGWTQGSGSNYVRS